MNTNNLLVAAALGFAFGTIAFIIAHPAQAQDIAHPVGACTQPWITRADAAQEDPKVNLHVIRTVPRFAEDQEWVDALGTSVPNFADIGITDWRIVAQGKSILAQPETAECVLAGGIVLASPKNAISS